jgi:hypothetical protein
MRHASVMLFVVLMPGLLAGCTQGAAPGAGGAPDGPGSDGFVGRAWVSDDPAAPPGRLRLFLADGTLVMDSCVETYRLARWERAGDGRLAWSEDTARVEAELVEVSGELLHLRLLLHGGATSEERYRPAPVPFVCPDLPRATASLDTGLGEAIASCQ